MNTSEKCDAQISCIRKKDLNSVLNIERKCFKQRSWTLEEVLDLSKNKRIIAKVALKNESIIGFIFSSSKHDRIRIINLAVDPDHQREKTGTLLINDLIEKVNASRKKSIEIFVRESNLSAQLFFKNNGFVCSDIRKDFFNDTGESAYRMVYFLNK